MKTLVDLLNYINQNEDKIWDEYISAKAHPDTQLPTWLAVYPVYGDSEGIYLHVDDVKAGERLILAKTLSQSSMAFQICAQSAARITIAANR